jgi:hypothetical protein
VEVGGEIDRPSAADIAADAEEVNRGALIDEVSEALGVESPSFLLILKPP